MLTVLLRKSQFCVISASCSLLLGQSESLIPGKTYYIHPSSSGPKGNAGDFAEYLMQNLNIHGTALNMRLRDESERKMATEYFREHPDAKFVSIASEFKAKDRESLMDPTEPKKFVASHTLGGGPDRAAAIEAAVQPRMWDGSNLQITSIYENAGPNGPKSTGYLTSGELKTWANEKLAEAQKISDASDKALQESRERERKAQEDKAKEDAKRQREADERRAKDDADRVKYWHEQMKYAEEQKRNADSTEEMRRKASQTALPVNPEYLPDDKQFDPNNPMAPYARIGAGERFSMVFAHVYSISKMEKSYNLITDPYTRKGISLKSGKKNQIIQLDDLETELKPIIRLPNGKEKKLNP